LDFPPRPRSGPSRRPRTRDEAERPAPEPQPPQPSAEGSGERSRNLARQARARRRRGETAARVLWALPAIALAVTIVAIGGRVFAAAMVLFAWVGLSELFRMTSRARPFELVAYAAVAGMIAAAHFGDSFQMVLAGVAFFPVLLAFVLTRESLHNVTWSIAVTVFAIVWIGLPFAHAVLLRDIPDHGGALLVDVLVATFLTDTFAYVGGRMFGSRPLAPLISPNKTVEGLLFGIAGGTAGFWFAGLYQDWLSGFDALLMGLCIACIAPLGDLFESAIKRDLDVKDSGGVFGPHGGLLDRLDAVLFTVVAGYYLSLAIVV
jgi:phosphatidate cytidylyltransferase